GTGRLCLRATQRRPHQPGRDAGPRRARVVPPFAGPAVLGRPTNRCLRRRPAGLRRLRRGVPGLRTEGAARSRGDGERQAGGAGVSATSPVFDTVWRNILSEFLGPAVLLLGARALTDRRNAAPGGYVEPLALGGLVWAIGLSLGGLTGYAINPARDLGPRLASSLLGWGTAVFRSPRGLLSAPTLLPP